ICVIPFEEPGIIIPGADYCAFREGWGCHPFTCHPCRLRSCKRSVAQVECQRHCPCRDVVKNSICKALHCLEKASYKTVLLLPCGHKITVTGGVGGAALAEG